MLVYGRASTKARMAWNEAIFMIFLRWFSGVHSRHRPPLVMNSSGKFSRSAWPPQGLVTKTFLFYWFSRIVGKVLNVFNAQLSCVSVLLTVSWDFCNLLINLVATESSDFDSGLVDWCTLGPLHFWLLVTYWSGLPGWASCFYYVFKSVRCRCKILWPRNVFTHTQVTREIFDGIFHD